MADTDQHTILVMSGPEGPSLYLDDYRIAGPKPWGGGTVLHEFTFADKDLIAAGFTLAPTPPDAPDVRGDAEHEWTTDDKHDYDWCRRCLLVRQANGSSDAKPCKGPAHVRPRNRPAPDATLDVERLARALAVMCGATKILSQRFDPGDYMAGLPAVGEFAAAIAREYAALSDPVTSTDKQP